MYACMHVCMYACVCVYACVYVYDMYVYMSKCVYLILDLKRINTPLHPQIKSYQTLIWTHEFLQLSAALLIVKGLSGRIQKCKQPGTVVDQFVVDVLHSCLCSRQRGETDASRLAAKGLRRTIAGQFFLYLECVSGV